MKTKINTPFFPCLGNGSPIADDLPIEQHVPSVDGDHEIPANNKNITLKLAASQPEKIKMDGGQQSDARGAEQDSASGRDHPITAADDRPTVPEAMDGADETDEADSATTDLEKHKQEAAKAFRMLDVTVKRGLGKFVDIGTALGTIHTEKLFRHGGYKSWTDYCSRGLGSSYKNCNYLIAGARIAKELSGLDAPGFGPGALKPTSESQVRHLDRLPSVEERRQTWIQAFMLEKRLPSEKKVKLLVDAILHVDGNRNNKKEEKEKEIKLLFEDLRKGIAAVETEDIRSNLEIVRTRLDALLFKRR